MTRVRLTWENEELAADIAGHAGYGPPGRDIVCAAVSMLAQALAASLQQAQEDGLLAACRCRVEEGIVQIRARAAPSGLPVIRGMTEVVCTGYRLLAEQYPDYVRVDTPEKARALDT